MTNFDPFNTIVKKPDTDRQIHLGKLYEHFAFLSTEQLKILASDGGFAQDLQELIQRYLTPKFEPINESKLIDDFWELTGTQREKILIEVIGWSPQKIRELYEDFGWNMSGVIIRNLREKALLKDFKIEVDKYLNV